MNKLKVVVNSLESVNLSDIVVYDMRNKSPFFDYLIISSATSDRQLQAAVSHIQDDLHENGYNVANVEGKNSNSWILVDAKDIIVNVFTKEERMYYNLEKMLAEIEELNLEDIRDLS